MDAAILKSPLDKAILEHVAALEGLTAEDIIRVSHDFFSQAWVFDTRQGRTFKVSDAVVNNIVYYVERYKRMAYIKPQFDLAELAKLKNIPPGFYMDSLNQTWFDEKPKPKPKPVNSCSPEALIVGFDLEDSFALAYFLGIYKPRHVEHYREMLQYPGLPVYITDRGPERKDFGAIEGLFLRGNHTVIDVME